MYWLQCRRGLQLTVLVKTYLHVNSRHCSRIFISQEKKIVILDPLLCPDRWVGTSASDIPSCWYMRSFTCLFRFGQVKWWWACRTTQRANTDRDEAVRGVWSSDKEARKKMHSWKGDRYEQYSLWRLLFFKLCRFRCCFAQNVILKVGVILKYSIIPSLIVFLFVYRTSLCSFFYLTSAVSPAHFSRTRFLSFTYLQFHPARQNMNDS